MLRILTATAITALALAPAAMAGTKSVDVRSFDEIETKGAMHVVYTAGPETSVIIETDGNDFSDADVSVDGNTLVITRVSLEKRGLFGGGANVKISDDGKTVKVNGKKKPYYTVRVTSPELTGIKVAQSSRGDVSGINAASFDARASSASTLTLAGRADSAEVSASSSGEIEAVGFEAGALDVSASSSGEVTTSTNGTGTVSVSASSSGEVSLRSAQAASFEVSASSGGEVELSGACASIDISASSGGDVDASKLQCEVATARASSGADVDAFASVSASGNASSGGDVTFN